MTLHGNTKRAIKAKKKAPTKKKAARKLPMKKSALSLSARQLVAEREKSARLRACLTREQAENEKLRQGLHRREADSESARTTAARVLSFSQDDYKRAQASNEAYRNQASRLNIEIADLNKKLAPMTKVAEFRKIANESFLTMVEDAYADGSTR